jgi:hypothetical protein
MPLAALSLLAPAGLLVCLLAILPVAVVALASRRQRRVARALGLKPASWRGVVAPAVLAASSCVALGIAAAQPVLTTANQQSARTSSEIVFVTDVSRSMLASAGPGEPTRLDRARAAVAELRAAVPEVPAGISGLTDRALPYVFPTLDAGVFAETLSRSVRIDAPPPQETSTVATSYAALTSLVRDGFYSSGTKHRTCVLVTDGETRSDSGEVAALAGPRGCRLVVVRVGTAADRIYRSDGLIVAGYRPESSAATAVERLARLAGGSAFSQGELTAAAAALKQAADTGPRERVGQEAKAHGLAPWFVGLALFGVVLMVIRAVRRPAGGLHRLRRHRYDAATGF